MSGWAFSSSSNTTTLYGLRRTASVSCPPSSYPTYPGGAPIRRETANFSIYSDISKRIIASSSPNRNVAKLLASSVFPTPVGPKNRKPPIGRCGFPSPVRLRRIACETAFTASSCPIMRSWRCSSICKILSVSLWVKRVTGIPVHLEATSAISSSVTCGTCLSCSSCHFCFKWSIYPFKRASVSFAAAAFSNSLFAIASSFSCTAWLYSSCFCLISGGSAAFFRRARAPASSNRSMALSGIARSVI